MKKIFLFGGTLVLLAGVAVGVFLLKRDQEIRTKAAPNTSLSLSPSSVTKEVSDSFNVNVEINTGSNLVAGVDMEITFNSQVINVTGVTTGSFFDSSQEIKKTIDNDAGKLFYSLGQFSGKSGSGTLAILTFEAKEAGISTLSFTENTSVTDINEGEVLQSKVGGTVTVGGTGGTVATATPTPTPTSTPTPTPTSTPTPTPTSTPSNSDSGAGDITTVTPTPTSTTRAIRTASPSPVPALPESGVSGPFIGLSLVGLGFLIAGFVLAIGF